MQDETCCPAGWLTATTVAADDIFVLHAGTMLVPLPAGGGRGHASVTASLHAAKGVAESFQWIGWPLFSPLASPVSRSGLLMPRSDEGPKVDEWRGVPRA